MEEWSGKKSQAGDAQPLNGESEESLESTIDNEKE